jgi:hypothetical protein
LRIYDIDEYADLYVAFEKLPEIPSPEILNLLGRLPVRHESMAFWELGKQLQRTNLGEVPPNFECEKGAGLWSVIRAAILAVKRESA